MMRLVILLLLLPFGINAQQTTVPAQRIVALAPHIVESLFDIGAGDRIVATVDFADYPAQALNIPRVGGYYGIQIEKIIALNPDLVVVWQGGNKATDIEQLEKLGLPLLYSDGKNIEGVAEELIKLGKATGLEKSAAKVAQQYKDKLQQITTQYQGKKPVSVFYQLWSQPLMSINKNTWIHQLIEVCGGNNVFANSTTDYPQLSMENVIVAAPELIVIPTEKSDKPQPIVDWQKWPSIPAVANNHFVNVNADLIHRYSRRMLTGLEKMCEDIDKFR